VMVYYPAGFSGFFEWLKAKFITLFAKSKA